MVQPVRRIFITGEPRLDRGFLLKGMKLAGLSGAETVIDAYSGVGTIALFMARKAGKVVGIEIVSKAVANARSNAELTAVNVELPREEYSGKMWNVR